MNRKDWLLLAIASAGTSGLSPVQLQKSLFLLGRKRKKYVGADFYEFEPHNYGPFSKDIYTDADLLGAAGYVTKERQPGKSWSVFRPTDAGGAVARKLRPSVPKEALSYLVEAVPWVKGQSFYDLVQTIYKHYPEYRANSVFRD